MCGISGIIFSNNKNLANYDYNNSSILLNSLRHRGPDGDGTWTNGKTIILNHNRLALLDSSKNGSQPMLDPTKRIVLVFNGEIYNYSNLREELVKLGYRFNSSSDTEVILAGYLKWGEEIFSRIDGMYAIVLHDVLLNKTYFKRDILGIKPLYYYFYDEQLLFSSEVQPFSLIHGLSLSSSKASILSHSLFGFVTEPHTIYNEIKAFEPGVLFSIEQHSFDLIKINRQNLSSLIKSDQCVYSKAEVLKTLENSINLTSKADFDITILLSSGVDSNFIYDVLQKSKSVSTFTLSAKEFGIYKYIGNANNNFLFDLTKNHMEELYVEYKGLFDQPTNDGFNIFVITKLMRQHGYKAGILGTGADELFHGYHFFKLIKIFLNNKKLMSSLFSNKYFIAFAKLFIRNEKVEHFSEYFDSVEFLYIFFRSLNSMMKIKEEFGADFFDEAYSDFNISGIFSEFDVNDLNIDVKLKIYDLSFYLRNQLLKDADVFSMRNGIELRLPFLNREVLKVGLNSKLNNKNFLIENLSNHEIQKFLYNRKKTGFNITNN